MVVKVGSEKVLIIQMKDSCREYPIGSWLHDDRVRFNWLGKSRAERLADALEHLPQEERLVVALMYFEGLGVHSVCAVLHLPPGTVERLHSTARRRLGGLTEVLPEPPVEGITWSRLPD